VEVLAALGCNIQGEYKLSDDLENSIFTNTEQKYMMLLPFERGMFAVS
jgi:hypothetical protein